MIILQTTNSLGFPGPENPAIKTPDTFRILVTADAFSSAGGVDTDQAWPRLLEAELSTKVNGQKSRSSLGVDNVLGLVSAMFNHEAISGGNESPVIIEHPFGPIFYFSSKADIKKFQTFAY